MGQFKTYVFLLLSLTAFAPAMADVAVTVQDQGTNPFGGATWTLGFEFSPVVDVNVTSLGFFDADANGLVDQHAVAIWDAAGNLLSSTLINSGDPLNGFYRFRAISPVQLTAGNNYVIASHDFNNDDAIRDDQAVVSTIHPDITMLDGRWGFPSGSIAFPGNSYNDPTLYFNTVSFEFTPIPEPRTAYLTLLGLAGLALFRASHACVTS